MASARKTSTERAKRSRLGHPLKPVSPVIEGVVHVRHRIRGQELECVLTAIMDVICILYARRRDNCTEVDIDELTQAITVLDAAWHILQNEISKR